ncbi:MAG: hisB [Cytophagaceae bacterium]|nr:hisB [Cytophagaceae bacterium]
MKKCVFLDRDGVINIDDVNYTYKVEQFVLVAGVKEALQLLHDKGYLLVLITNQSGIAKGIYGHEDVTKCHAYMHELTGSLIDDIFYSPYHQTFTNSLGRKPGSLLFEKAIAKHDIDISTSYMVGDRGRDLVPARKLGLKTVHIHEEGHPAETADYIAKDLLDASNWILKQGTS